jgi:hypothetical protein
MLPDLCKTLNDPHIFGSDIAAQQRTISFWDQELLDKADQQRSIWFWDQELLDKV